MGRELKSYDHRYADTVDQIHALVYLPGLASPAFTTPILHRRPLWPAMQTSFPIVHACGSAPHTLALQACNTLERWVLHRPHPRLKI